MDSPSSYLINTREAAKHLGVSKSFLDKTRVTGTGPTYIKIGRAVRYDPHELKSWAALRIKQRTDEAA